MVLHHGLGDKLGVVDRIGAGSSRGIAVDMSTAECFDCGFRNPGGAEFCQDCGCEQPLKPVAAAQICQMCGTVASGRFCRACGCFVDSVTPAAGGRQATSQTKRRVVETSYEAFLRDVSDASLEMPVVLLVWREGDGISGGFLNTLTGCFERVSSPGRLVTLDLDVGENIKVARQLEIKSVPMVLVFRNKTPVDGFIGALPQPQITEFFRKNGFKAADRARPEAASGARETAAPQRYAERGREAEPLTAAPAASADQDPVKIKPSAKRSPWIYYAVGALLVAIGFSILANHKSAEPDRTAADKPQSATTPNAVPDSATFNDGMAAYKNGDFQRAGRIWDRLVDRGNIAAAVNLGVLYYTGEGVPKNLAAAAELFRKAADAGDEQAQFNLGLMYANGQGVDRDPNKALEYFRKSAANGIQQAQSEMEKLLAAAPRQTTRGEDATANSGRDQSGPSFDCAKANGTAEKLICASPYLSAQDRDMAKSYGALRGVTNAPDDLRRDQLAWIRQRNACDTNDCLTEAYRQRIRSLNSALPR